MNTSSRGFNPLVLILALVVVLGAGWYLSQQGSLFSSSTEVNLATTSPQNTESVAAELEVVITEDSTQIGEFTGYYESVEREGLEEIPTSTCHTLVVLKGAPNLTQYFKDMVLRGNTVQSVTAQGQLRINLPWSEVSEADKAVIQTSASSSPVTLSLKKKLQVGGHAALCHSFFSYLRIES